jgi:RNA polymerase sigma-70 factor (sigma-E family)
VTTSAPRCCDLWRVTRGGASFVRWGVAVLHADRRFDRGATACHDRVVATTGSLLADALGAWMATSAGVPSAATIAGPAVDGVDDVDAFVVALFAEHGRSLVRLARLFVDDRNAAEDLVQEAFIRLARNAGRVREPARAPAYLRSIVLNLARDQNRRGLVSMRHRSALAIGHVVSDEDELVLREDQRQVIDALRELPVRQRTCLVLRYYDELGPDEIADALGISRNSVKTHLQRGLAALEERLAAGVVAQ